jgi:Sulfotransferase domain
VRERSALRRWVAKRRRGLLRLLKADAQGGERGSASRQGRGASSGGIDQAPPVPVPAPGQRTGPPDFVGIGVQRCGTTRWFDLISSHPEIAPTLPQKELHFFDRFHARWPTAEELAAYSLQFPRSEGQKAGEWTPLYLSAPWVPPMLAAAAPDARLLVLLRDPVERYLSGIALDERVAARRGVPLSRYAPLDALVRGFYHAQLAHLLRHFERSQVLVLQYERCTREPAAELRRTFEFIGVSPQFEADLDHHPQQTEKPPLDEQTRAAYVAAYSDDVRRLLADFPELDARLWPNFASLAP